MDVQTLLIVNVANMLIIAALLPLIMGQRLSIAAAAARRSVMVSALGWSLMIGSNYMPERWLDQSLSTLSIACFCLGHWLLYRALSDWLGPRPFERLMRAAVILAPIGYCLLFSNYAMRVGWSNSLLALQLAIIAWGTLNTQTDVRGPWRWAMLASTGIMAALTFGRGVIGVFTDLYPSFLTPHPWNVAAMLAANVTLVVVNMSVLVAWREEAELALRKLAVTDPLTSLLNRRGWLEQANSLFSQAQRHQLPLALLALDIDHFKDINDLYGHAAGDHALKLFGRVLRLGQRGGDVVGRIGGEEFCALLPLADVHAAEGFDLRLRSSLAAHRLAELSHELDFSAGLAVLGPEDKSLETLMRRADEALYRAKAEGRGRMINAASSGAAAITSSSTLLRPNPQSQSG